MSPDIQANFAVLGWSVGGGFLAVFFALHKICERIEKLEATSAVRERDTTEAEK